MACCGPAQLRGQPSASCRRLAVGGRLSSAAAARWAQPGQRAPGRLAVTHRRKLAAVSQRSCAGPPGHPTIGGDRPTHTWRPGWRRRLVRGFRWTLVDRVHALRQFRVPPLSGQRDLGHAFIAHDQFPCAHRPEQGRSRCQRSAALTTDALGAREWRLPARRWAADEAPIRLYNWSPTEAFRMPR